ncbi:MAG: DUF2141 domain-containing protein [Asticcacaulis sp.]
MKTQLFSVIAAFALMAPVATTAQSANPSAATVEVRFSGGVPGGPIFVQLSSEAEFMRPTRFADRVAVSADGTAVARFTGVPAGTYAVVSFQDVNNDGRLNFGMMGEPTEPWGYSRDARGVMGPPTFKDAAIQVGPKGAIIPVRLVR